MKKIIISVFVVALFGAVFLISSNQGAQPNPPSQASVSNAISLDEFLKQNSASPEIAEAYRFAKENPQGVLSIVKCYCGCLKNGSGHKNNRDCFFNEDGSVDLMGLNCGLCVKTALISKQMLAEGKTVQEISDYVDAKWGKDI